MYSDPTKYPDKPPLEPTTPATPYNNPYEMTSPYSGDVPPPPPKQGHKGLIGALVSILCLIMLPGGVLFAVMRGSSQPSSTQATPALGSTPTSTVTPPQTAVPTVQPYDAMSLLQDFQAHGLPLDQLHNDLSINQFVGSQYDTVIQTQSTAEFVEPSFCNGPCDVGSV